MCKYSEIEFKFRGLKLIEVDNNNHRLNPNNPTRDTADPQIIQIRSELRKLRKAMKIECAFTVAVKEVQISYSEHLPHDEESELYEQLIDLLKIREAKMHATGRIRFFLLERPEIVIERMTDMPDLRSMKKMAGHQIITEQDYSEKIMALLSGHSESNTAVITAYCEKQFKLGDLQGLNAILEDCVSN